MRLTAALRARARPHVNALRRRRMERRLAGPRLLRQFAADHPEAVFVEIGANDGEQHDHLREFILSLRWRGVMVEPVPYIFERLQANYAGVERVALEQVVIGDRDGTVPFHYLVDAPAEERAALPDWYDGIGSLSRDVLLAHDRHMPDIRDRLVTEALPVVTFQTLCERHSLDQVDLVLIDTEGYDWEIIKTIHLSARRPRLLIYEHFHLSPDDREQCRRHLRADGYALMEEGFDTYCVDERAEPRLAVAARRLQPAIPALSVHDELP